MSLDFSPGLKAKVAFYIWLSLFVGLAGIFSSYVFRGIPVESNIMALLPETHRDPVVERAWDQFSDNISKRVLFMISGEDAISASTELEHKLKNTGLFSSVLFRINKSSEKESGVFYLPHITRLLSDNDRNLLENKNASVIYDRAIHFFYSPISSVHPDLLVKDPFLLFPEFLNSIPRPKAELGRNGEVFFRDNNGVKHYSVTANIKGDLFSLVEQAKLESVLNESTRYIESKYLSIRILKTGAVFYSASAGARAKAEISTIGVGSVVGILLLIVIVFRSALPLLMSIVSIGFGILLAFVGTIIFFGKIHLFTLVFGTSLIGVSVDYAFHYFSTKLEHEKNWTGWHAVSHILPGITLGVITSVIAYLALALTPFPGLQQLAVFSSIGLIGAFCTVVISFPVVSRHCITSRSLLLNSAKIQLGFWQGKIKYILIVFVALVIVNIAGWSQLSVEDDIRLLQPPAADLKQQEKKIREIIKQSYTNYLLVIQGGDSEDVLQKEEEVTSLLDKMKGDALDNYHAISKHVPSVKRQSDNTLVIQEQVISPMLNKIATELGLMDSSIESIREYWNGNQPFLKLEDWLQHSSSKANQYLLVGNINGKFASIIVLEGVKNNHVFEQMEKNISGITYINKTDEVSDVFREYRQRITWMVVAGYGIILLLLTRRYSLKKAIIVVLVPAIAAMTSVAMAGLTGLPWNLFGVLALILILGVGIDYTLFLAEARQKYESTMIAIWMSALTTILAFGLLSLSDTPAMHTFGIILFTGITIALLLSPLVVMADQKIKR
ncbi:MAG: MMPL family transporter [Gammaproteobacteria bacterium]|nr:MMPL family transporter [Gammaproteobacteria bacterium]MDH5592806.1 MMPL family transporter [Gammaproteobacteria bacterium]